MNALIDTHTHLYTEEFDADTRERGPSPGYRPAPPPP